MAPATPASSTAVEDSSASSIIFCPTSGFHLLKIDGYSRTKAMPVGSFVKSRPFKIGGHSWYISYYPNGDNETNRGYASVFLHLIVPAERLYLFVKARYGLSLVDNNGVSPKGANPPTRHDEFSMGSYHGHQRFFNNEDLERSGSGQLVDDCFSIRVDIGVIGDEFPYRTEETAVAPEPAPPEAMQPADLQRDLADLLASKEGADVTFIVGDEAFEAHRLILAARSPVFKAQLFGAMKESTAPDHAIHIEDMSPVIFRALLHFLYTDSLPPELEEDVVTQHLLVTADRYDLQKLKLMCEERLCEYIDAGNAATILALAEQHSCTGLKKACLKFIRSPSYA